MQEITSHKVNSLNEAIEVAALGEPGQGGAHVRYKIGVPLRDPAERYVEENSRLMRTHCDLNFQDGPIPDGINGISNEALLAVVEHRLQGFQSGDFACRENAIALTKLQEAMLWLHKRTRDRVARGVEGTHTV